MSTSVSQSDIASSNNRLIGRRKNRDRTTKWLLIAAATLLLGLVFLLVITTQGNISGSEFSPTHFQQREFHFYEIPLLHLQITPIRRKVTTPVTASYLKQMSLVPVPKGQPVDWHLVSISRGFSGTSDAEAKLLTDQLNLSPDGDLYWKTWTADHPQLAAVFWPVIQKLAERELYILMPRLFVLAQTDQPTSDLTAGDLQASIDAYLIDQYASLIKDMVAADRTELAASLAAEASADYPQAANWSSFLVKAIR